MDIHINERLDYSRSCTQSFWTRDGRAWSWIGGFAILLTDAVILPIDHHISRTGCCSLSPLPISEPHHRAHTPSEVQPSSILLPLCRCSGRRSRQQLTEPPHQRALDTALTHHPRSVVLHVRASLHPAKSNPRRLRPQPRHTIRRRRQLIARPPLLHRRPGQLVHQSSLRHIWLCGWRHHPMVFGPAKRVEWGLLLKGGGGDCVLSYPPPPLPCSHECPCQDGEE